MTVEIWHYDGKLAIGGQVYRIGRVKARERREATANLRDAHDKGPEEGRAAILDLLEGVTDAPRAILDKLEVKQLGRMCCLALGVELDCNVF